MGSILACRSLKVKEPYYVEELGLYLYSGEELSYYIYHNASLISEDFLDERLFRFIGKELGMENLELKLRKWADQAELSELLLVILQDIHYYNGDELFAFREQLSALSRKSPAMRLMDKADALFRRGRYSTAGLFYDRLLHGDEPELRDGGFTARAWAGRGMALARQYQWQDAVSCLEKAYELAPKDQYLKKICQIRQMNPEIRVGEGIPAPREEQLAVWKQELTDAWEQAKDEQKVKDVLSWLDKDGIRRSYGLQELVQEWKRDFRRSLGSV